MQFFKNYTVYIYIYIYIYMYIFFVQRGKQKKVTFHAKTNTKITSIGRFRAVLGSGRQTLEQTIAQTYIGIIYIYIYI